MSFTVFLFLFLVMTGNLHADEYVAFSLKVAKERIVSTPKGKDYRKLHPEVFTLGGITAVRGLVYDRKTGDIILVGERDIDRAILTLDDFVVALRARFIHGKWPLVSIDPTEETKKTEMQIVRFEGGIEDTQFGEDLFDADYRLKKIGMGLLEAGLPGLKTYWDLGMERAKEGTGGSHKISSRFWFYPVLPSVSVREDVVAIKGLKVGVFTEVLSAEIDGNKIEDLSTFQNIAGDEFARGVSDNFDRLAEVHPSFSRLQGLDEMVALTKAIEEMAEKPGLSYWLKDYQIRKFKTKKEIEVLKKKGDYEFPVTGRVYRGFQELSGGVELMAVALRLKAGDVTALKDAVLKTKPKSDTLSWGFLVSEWLIPTSPEMLKFEDVTELFFHALFLQNQKRYKEALTLYEKIIQLKPGWDWPYNNRGLVYRNIGQYDNSISNYKKAIEINPMFAEAYNNRGVAYTKISLWDQAISDLTKALEINPWLSEAYNNRGICYRNKGEYDSAISDYNKALEINPSNAGAYNNRGVTYFSQGKYNLAISDYEKALEINPSLTDAYNNRGLAYAANGLYDKAISDYTHALEIDPENANAYVNRGNAYVQGKGGYNQAILDYTKALEIDLNPQTYIYRALAYAQGKGKYDQAILDLNKAIEINPSPEAYTNRGLIYHYKGEYTKAISDYNEALKINPKYAEAYLNKALIYEKLHRFKDAVEAYGAFAEYAQPHYSLYIEQVRQKINELKKKIANSNLLYFRTF